MLQKLKKRQRTPRNALSGCVTLSSSHHVWIIPAKLVSMLSQTKTFGPRVSLTQCQLALNQALTFRLGTQFMNEVESSAQIKVARFSECKCVMHQPDTVR